MAFDCEIELAVGRKGAGVLRVSNAFWNPRLEDAYSKSGIGMTAGVDETYRVLSVF